MGITGLYKILSACGDDAHLNEYRKVVDTVVHDVTIMSHNFVKLKSITLKVVKLSQ